ncbi:hypothetical protein RJ639_030441 [Escallonia herrerae]|uniref:Pentatricopeptide repeat-containing protein n=1 Tax=Escallonia herrerae TaxID=1293975 RepID=A0AA89BBX0_9ASTE|nr:hypothetical protein RJ639_030441 [Escallonia herrerae]
MVEEGVEMDSRSFVFALKACEMLGANAMLDMYVKCGCLITAREIFEKMETRDVFTWTSMINGFAKNGELDLARNYFDEMPSRNVVSWNVMIADVYAKCGSINEATHLFDDMQERDLVSWNSMIVACAAHGLAEKALILFEQMKNMKYKPDHIRWRPIGL